VRFKKYNQMGPDVLAEKVLREVPEQFMSYVNMMGIKPEKDFKKSPSRVS
jgi:hypothetical protein